MPETTNNDAPDADRPTARTGQEGPGDTGAARPPSRAEAERAARETVRRSAERAADGAGPASASPTDTAP